VRENGTFVGAAFCRPWVLQVRETGGRMPPLHMGNAKNLHICKNRGLHLPKKYAKLSKIVPKKWKKHELVPSKFCFIFADCRA